MQNTTISPFGDKENSDGLCHISAVANYFIERSKKDKIILTNLSMQKLVYFAYGWIRVYPGKKLFYDRIEAWQYGPVIPSLYHQLKRYGSKQITQKLVEYDYEKNEFFSWNLTEGTAIREMMGRIWDRYKSLPPNAMVALTHKRGTPWFETIKKHGYKAEIDDELIFNHFQELVNKLTQRKGIIWNS